MMLTGILLLFAAQQAQYSFTVEDPAEPVVQCRLELRELAPEAEPFHLRMPQGFAYAKLPRPLLQGELTSDAKITREGPYLWTLDPEGASEVVVEWAVPLKHRSAPEVAGRDEYEYPYLRSDHGMLVMGTMAVMPEALDEDQIRVRFQLPEGWPVHAPWPARSEGMYAPPSMSALRDDLIAIGHWDVHEEEVAGMQLKIAFAPGQEKLRAGVVEQTAPIVRAMLEHFGTTPQEAYLFLFGEPQRGGYGGSPKTQSMTLYVAPDLPVDFALKGMTHLIAHEFHHTWMRARCQPEDELRFLAEGFTDYFAYFVPWRAGMVSDLEFRATLETKLNLAEQAHQAAQASLQSAGGPEFFQGGAAYNLVYAGGLAMGLYLDLALRKADHGSTLEEMLRAFYEDPRWKDDPKAQVEHLLAVLQAGGRADLAKIVLDLSTSRAPIDWQQSFEALGYPVKRSVVPAELSIRANFDGTTITAIDPQGCGGQIGLQQGDRLLQVNGVEVSNESEVREAFPQLLEGQFHIDYVRADGERVELRAPRPEKFQFSLPDTLISDLRKE